MEHFPLPPPCMNVANRLQRTFLLAEMYTSLQCWSTPNNRMRCSLKRYWHQRWGWLFQDYSMSSLAMENMVCHSCACPAARSSAFGMHCSVALACKNYARFRTNVCWVGAVTVHIYYLALFRTHLEVVEIWMVHLQPLQPLLQPPHLPPEEARAVVVA